MFMSMVHFELIFLYDASFAQRFIFCIWLSSSHRILFSQKSVAFMYDLVSGLSVPLHLPTCLFFHQYHTVKIAIIL